MRDFRTWKLYPYGDLHNDKTDDNLYNDQADNDLHNDKIYFDI